MEEKEDCEELLEIMQGQKPAGQIPNSASPRLMSKAFSDLQLLSVLLAANTLISLKLVPLLVRNFNGKFPMTLASPKILGSPRQSRLYLHCFIHWPL